MQTDKWKDIVVLQTQNISPHAMTINAYFSQLALYNQWMNGKQMGIDVGATDPLLLLPDAP